MDRGVQLGDFVSVFDGNRELLAAFRQGDRKALAQVYFHYFDQVSILVRRGFTIEAQGHVYVRGAIDDQEEKDLIQEVFARAFSEKTRLAYDGIQPYRPFLLRIGKNILIDRHRTEKRRPEVSLEQLSNDKGDHGVGEIDTILGDNRLFGDEPKLPMEEQLHWEKQLTAAKKYLESLPDELKRFVHLRFEEEHSQYEVASLLGISRRCVRTLENKIRKGLKRHLATNGIG